MRPRRRLTDAEVDAIRAWWAQRQALGTQADKAREIGCSRQTIANICSQPDYRPGLRTRTCRS